jgi:mRNA interferase RelE/StbE
MRLIINKSYLKDIRGVSHTVQIQSAEALENLVNAPTFSDIQNFKPMTGHPGYYRIRIGQYRIGLRWDGVQFFAERIGTRGDIYKTYPPK